MCLFAKAAQRLSFGPDDREPASGHSRPALAPTNGAPIVEKLALFIVFHLFGENRGIAAPICKTGDGKGRAENQRDQGKLSLS